MGEPQPLSALSSTCWKPRSPQSLRFLHTCLLSGGAGCSLKAYVPQESGPSTLPLPWSFPGLRQGSSELGVSSGPSVPLPAQRRARRGQGRCTGSHGSLWQSLHQNA